MGDCGLRSKRPLLWLANSWFRLKMHKYSHQTICLTDKAIVIMKLKQLLTLVCCNIIVGSSIIGTASSFSFNLSENPASDCALLVNESAVKLSEQRTKFYWRIWNYIKTKVHPLFPNIGIRRKAMQRLFFFFLLSTIFYFQFFTNNTT